MESPFCNINFFRWHKFYFCQKNVFFVTVTLFVKKNLFCQKHFFKTFFTWFPRGRFCEKWDVLLSRIPEIPTLWSPVCKPHFRTVWASACRAKWEKLATLPGLPAGKGRHKPDLFCLSHFVFPNTGREVPLLCPAATGRPRSWLVQPWPAIVPKILEEAHQ